MNILPIYQNISSCSEFDMQKSVVEILSKSELWSSAMIYREVSIPNIGRISDIIVKISNRKIVNIECKLTNHQEVFAQAKDHLLWADYSYICLHASALIPAYAIQNMIDSKIGLLLWTPEIIVEVLLAYYNKNKDKFLRKLVVEKLLKKQQKLTGSKESDLQQTLYDDSTQEKDLSRQG